MNKLMAEVLKKKAKDEIVEEFETPETKASNETVSSTNDLVVTSAGSLDVAVQAHAESGTLSFSNMNSTVAGNTGSYTYTLELLISVTNEVEVDVTDPTLVSISPSTGG